MAGFDKSFRLTHDQATKIMEVTPKTLTEMRRNGEVPFERDTKNRIRYSWYQLEKLKDCRNSDIYESDIVDRRARAAAPKTIWQKRCFKALNCVDRHLWEHDAGTRFTTDAIDSLETAILRGGEDDRVDLAF